MIVGFDPGTKSAVAVLDFDGNVVLLETFSGGISEAVNRIRRAGKPVIIASDKSRLPAVEKLAAKFGAKPFFPDRNLTVEEKKKLTRGYSFSDDHQMDALAAALFAYRNYSDLISRIRRREAEIFEKLVKAEEPNIKAALRERKEEKRIIKKRNVELDKRVRDLERRVKILNALLKEKEDELFEVKDELERIKDEKEIEIWRDRKIKKLESVIEILKEEKKARIRLEKKLSEAHSRLLSIEAELQAMKKQKDPGKKEDIRQRILRMIKEYKARFR